METMYKADRLYNEMMEVDQKIKALEVKDEQSITEYFRLYEKLIYNHKWIGSVYDIYADDAKLYRENGDLYDGAHAIMQEALKFTAAFPDLKIHMRDCFAVKKGDEYKVWQYYTMEGSNHNQSIYGPATMRELNPNECITMSMATVRNINGKWRIVREFTMYSMECIKAACKPAEQ